jgi:hypothetical protein
MTADRQFEPISKLASGGRQPPDGLHLVSIQVAKQSFATPLRTSGNDSVSFDRLRVIPTAFGGRENWETAPNCGMRDWLATVTKRGVAGRESVQNADQSS